MERTKFSTLLPTKKRGRPTAQERKLNEDHLKYFAREIVKIQSTLDFKVSARGWCYLLEGKGIITKGQFSQAESEINNCRKSGLLPLNICADDLKRSTENQITPDDTILEDYIENSALSLADFDTAIDNIASSYYPLHPAQFQDCYIEMAVEKIDLVGLFRPVCEKYGIPITNFGGWGDLNSRGKMLERYDKWITEGKKLVLLYCGDHDPGGLIITDRLRSNLEDIERAVHSEGLTEYIDIVRFGLDYDFIEANNLTWIDNLETSSGGDLSDRRHADHNKPYVQDYIRQYGVRKCEANALVVNVSTGRQLCESAIEQYISSEGIIEYNNRLNTIQKQVREGISTRFNELLQR